MHHPTRKNRYPVSATALRVPLKASESMVDMRASKQEAPPARIVHDFGNLSFFAKPSTYIQPKLMVNSPGDAHEQEADRMAERVMRMPMTQHHASPLSIVSLSGGMLQRKCATCEAEAEKEDTLMRKAENGGGLMASPKLISQLNGSKGGGIPLPQNSRSLMEDAFGTDFSGVRVHTDARAAEMSRGIQARAFTHGSDIYFNQGQYNPAAPEGRRLLAHELTHTVQQGGGTGTRLQRATHGGIAGAPANWSTQVSQATTSAAKAALMQTAVGSSVTISDRTAQSSSDTSPDPAHLAPYTAGSPTVNFDENLNTKTGRSGSRTLTNNAGYTFTHNGTNYVVLGNLALDGNNYYKTVYILNHELDHVRQNIAGSRLTGNASELDAWTSSFIREFHRMYMITDNGTDCSIGYQNYQTFTTLIGHYEQATASEQQSSCARIVAYYNSVIQPHAGHLKVFRFWIRRTLDRTPHTLADDLIRQLSLSINASEGIATYQRFPCTGITNLTFPVAPTPDLPTFPAPRGTGAPARP